MNTSSVLTTLSNPFIRPFDRIGVVVLIATIFPLCVIGVIGNAVTIATILVSPRLKSAWYDLIFSLSLSDLISAVNSPLYIYRKVWGFDEWKLPAFVCKIFWGFTSWTRCSTALHITWFSILRFISIKWPHSFNNVLVRYTKMSIFLIWFLTFATGFVPYLRVRPEIRDRYDLFPTSKTAVCSPTKDLYNYFLIVYQFIFISYVIIPCILVIITSIAIGIKVYTMRKDRRKKQGNRLNQVAEAKRTRKENQLLLQLGLIVGSFILGYFPVLGVVILRIFSTNSGPEGESLNWWFSTVQYILLRLSECLNPFFYNLASSKMRKETITLMRRVCLKITCKADAPANGRPDNIRSPNIATNCTNIACSKV